MDNLLELLSQNRVFAHLTDTQRERAAGNCLARRYRKQEIITLYDEVWPYLFMVGQGRVHAVKESGEGRQLIVTDLCPGAILWGFAFCIQGARMPVTLIAQQDCLLYLWQRQDLLPILLENGRALWELTCMMAGRMQQASNLVDGLAFQSVTGRVARLVLERFGDRVGKPVARDLTLEEMAAMVGTTREVVCRTLYRLAEEEMIQITRTEFILVDQDALEQLATQQ